MTTNKRDEALELYIHIPFCIQKCLYCDFLSAPATRQVQNAYMEALCSEIEGRGRLLKIASCGLEAVPGKRPVSSIFIGGGTPSSVDCHWIERLMQTIRDTFCLQGDAEISIEVNPGTITGEELKRYRLAGINRLSIGCQSTRDRELKRIGRIHTYEQFLEAYQGAKEAGFEQINVDLMSALPGQSLSDWETNLTRILSLEPAHISAYSLIVEEGTPFFTMAQRGELDLPDEETERAMYWRTAQLLKENGYEHYEISNYAKPGFACRHNCGYWTGKDYLGFGIGAASLYENVRFSNTSSLQVYLENPEGSLQNIQLLSAEEQMEETMFLGLRMSAGVSEAEFEALYGVSLFEEYGKEIEESMEEGLLEHREGRIFLSSRGVDLSNYVMARFLKH